MKYRRVLKNNGLWVQWNILETVRSSWKAMEDYRSLNTQLMISFHYWMLPPQSITSILESVTNDRTNGRTEILKYWVVLCATKNEPHFKFQIKMPLINFHVVWWCLLTNFQWQNNWFNLKKRFTILRNFPDSWYTTRVVGTKINDFMQAPNQAWRIGARVK